MARLALWLKRHCSPNFEQKILADVLKNSFQSSIWSFFWKKNNNLYFVWTEQKILPGVVKTTFCVSRGSFWVKKFFEVFQKFITFLNSQRNMFVWYCQSCILSVQKNILHDIFFECFRNFKFFGLWAKKFGLEAKRIVNFPHNFSLLALRDIQSNLPL